MSPDAYPEYLHGEYSTDVHLTGVDCVGFETSLSQCLALGYTFCMDRESYAGVMCLDGV